MSRVRDEKGAAWGGKAQGGVFLLAEWRPEWHGSDHRQVTIEASAAPESSANSGYRGVKQTREQARLAAEAEAAMRAALAAEAVGGLPDGVELLGGPHAEVEYSLIDNSVLCGD